MNYLKDTGQIDWKSHPELRVAIYKLLKDRVGEYSSKEFHSNGKPIGMTSKHFNIILKSICRDVGLPEDKYQAVHTQIAWATTEQSNANSGNKKVTLANRVAAIKADWMTLKDVIALNI